MSAEPAGTPSGVDWDLATGTALRLVKAGPELSAREVAEVVADLRGCAVRAQAYVAEVTRLPTEGAPRAPVLVVDRVGWIRANVEAFASIMEPLTDRMREAAEEAQKPRTGSLAARASGVEVGVLLSYLATKVLGQFDPYLEPAGRLMLVAPNVALVERELGVPHHDFRLWVCLHEETHRVQFTAVPWLRDHLRGLISEVVASADLGVDALTDMIKAAVGRVRDRGNTSPDQELSLLDLVQTPRQRVLIDQITAIMTLLEGHADYMMDQVGPDVIPSIVQIRATFTQRRGGQGIDKIIRRLLGLDAKMRQYRDGAAFCTAVIGAVGLDGFNRVWTDPTTLPTREEITEPARWTARVLPDVTEPPDTPG